MVRQSGSVTLPLRSFGAGAFEARPPLPLRSATLAACAAARGGVFLLDLAHGLGDAGVAAGGIGEVGGQLVAAGVAEGLVVGGVVGLVLLSDAADLGLQAPAGQRLQRRRVSTHLGAVDRHHTNLDHAGGEGQAQHLGKEPVDGLGLVLDKARDRRVVRRLIAGDPPERDVLDAAQLDPTRRALALAPGQQDQGDKHLGVIGTASPAVGAVGSCERAQVELVDGACDETGQVVLGKPVIETRRQKEPLGPVATPVRERHTLMIPNTNRKREHPQENPHFATGSIASPSSPQLRAPERPRVRS
jgi:hypothetical protein